MLGRFTVKLGTFRTLSQLIKYINDVKYIYREDRKFYTITLMGYYIYKGQRTSYKYVLRPLTHNTKAIRNAIEKRKANYNI